MPVQKGRPYQDGKVIQKRVSEFIPKSESLSLQNVLITDYNPIVIKGNKTELNQIVKWSSSRWNELKKADVVKRLVDAIREGTNGEWEYGTGSFSESGHLAGYQYRLKIGDGQKYLLTNRDNKITVYQINPAKKSIPKKSKIETKIFPPKFNYDQWIKDNEENKTPLDPEDIKQLLPQIQRKERISYTLDPEGYHFSIKIVKLRKDQFSNWTCRKIPQGTLALAVKEQYGDQRYYRTTYYPLDEIEFVDIDPFKEYLEEKVGKDYSKILMIKKED